ncbi:MAG: hypothetical protein [Arizlama microvirus]|nr:MAG: hypothetical protein [Arizlama microvirus]
MKIRVPGYGTQNAAATVRKWWDNDQNKWRYELTFEVADTTVDPDEIAKRLSLSQWGKLITCLNPWGKGGDRGQKKQAH